MRRAILVALLFLGTPAAQAGFFGFSSGACKPREAVSEAIRQSYEKAALDFVTTILHGDFVRARSQMRTELRNALTEQAFVNSISPNAEAFKSIGALDVSHSYLVEVGMTAGNGQQIIVCQSDMKVDMTSPQGRVYLVTDATPTEAYVLVEGHVATGSWTFTLWMVRIKDAWQVSHLHVAPPSDWDMTPDDFFNLATEQAEKSHSLNAYLFYLGVMATDYRGQKFSPGIRTESEARLKQLKLPAEFQGKTPYSMRLGQSTYHVQSVHLAADERKPALEITYRSDIPQNEALFRDLKADRPDYLEGFESIIAIAVDAFGNRTRTVERLL